MRNFVRRVQFYAQMAVNFYLDNRTDRKGDAPIRMSVTIRGARYLTSTGYKMAPAKWDNTRQQVRRGCSNSAGVTYSVINSVLARIVEHFTAYENECISGGIRPNLDDLKNEFAGCLGRKIVVDADYAMELYKSNVE